MQHKFVEHMPDIINEGTLYISIKFGTAIHKCCCGCGQEVVTPITPSDWSLTFDGETVSLTPSIGNWNFKCRSHYFIKKNQILWCGSRHEELVRGDRQRCSSDSNLYHQKVSKSVLINLWTKLKNLL